MNQWFATGPHLDEAFHVFDGCGCEILGPFTVTEAKKVAKTFNKHNISGRGIDERMDRLIAKTLIRK